MQGASIAPSASPDGIALFKLERRLDRAPFRVVQRLAQRWRERQRGYAAGATFGPLGDQSPHASVASLSEALARALAFGALESARSLAERLQALEGTSLATPARTLVLETLVMLGEQERALGVAQRHRDQLASCAPGVSLLELLGLGDGALYLPGGGPNMLRFSREIARGGRNAEWLARQLQAGPARWLRTPELHLLFFSALLHRDRDRALGFLNRFLGLHGLARVCWNDAAGDNVLARLGFEAERRRPAGPLVSVLVAAHNAARTLGYAVDSLLAQSYQKLEILVCDDASTDGTLEQLRQRYAAENRVRLFRSASNQGAYNVRNALAARARGEILTFHDADDLAFPGRINQQVQRLERRGAVACVTSFLRMDADGSCVFFKNQKANRLCMVSLMLRREAFDEVGPFRAARVGADWELYSALHARFGTHRVSRIAAPTMLGLWSAGSATRAVGMEALEDGYRSQARRVYGELVFRQNQAGYPHVTSADVDARLRAVGNYVEKADLIEVT